MIFLTSMVNAPAAPPAAGIQESDWRSLDMVKVPSFFLYAADPLGGGGAIIIVVYVRRRSLARCSSDQTRPAFYGPGAESLMIPPPPRPPSIGEEEEGGNRRKRTLKLVPPKGRAAVVDRGLDQRRRWQSSSDGNGNIN